ncbi:MAG: extracellular solute-binding protein [Tepidisphaeraceae bacterium]
MPFVFRQKPPQGDWQPGDPVIVVVSPHNEAIRFEFAQAFSKWHNAKYGKPVKIDWRNIGGTTEISRYLASEYAASTKAWWTNDKKNGWPGIAADDVTKSTPPADKDGAVIWKAYRETDSPDAITCKIDLFFGGGEFDHSNAFRSGFTVPVEKELPAELFKKDGIDLIPASFGGETWRTPSVMGNVVSTFGVIYNVDRIKELGITTPPAQWNDMADFKYFGQVGLADPTKSGSIAKAFEMIVHQKMHDALVAAGFDDPQIAANEKVIADYKKSKGAAYQRGDVPEGLAAYQAALEKGFVDGLALVQKIGANSRYFTDSASKVPIDVSVGDAAVGMAIDFYGRFQAEATRAPDGSERMKFVTPVGGTSVSVDPISLLRGAGGSATTPEAQKETRQTAIHFIEFILSEDGQKLWTYKPGTPGGPEKYALRRLPIRRSFYPSANPALDALAKEHDSHATDDLADPHIDPYVVGKQFTYYPRWTADHFAFFRYIVRAMCMDAGDELKAAWKRSNVNKTPWTFELPTLHLSTSDGKSADVQLNWRTAPDVAGKKYDSIEVMRVLTQSFQDQYRKTN